jgi:hypothetical protein
LDESDDVTNLKITLKPMEIRTFIIKTDQNNDDIDNDNDNSGKSSGLISSAALLLIVLLAGSHTLPV